MDADLSCCPDIQHNDVHYIQTLPLTSFIYLLRLTKWTGSSGDRTIPQSLPSLQVRLALEIIFEGVQGASDVGTVQATSAAGDVLRIADMLTLTHQPAAGSGSSASLILEWEGGPMGDMLADAITAVILQVSATHDPS